MIIGNVKHLDVEDDIKRMSSVKSNFIDTEIFNDALADTKDMKNTINDRNEEQPFFKKLSEDLFHSLYKVRPEIYNKANVVDSLQMENDLVNEIVNDPKFNKLRRNTANDIFNSTYGLNMFQEQAYQTIQQWIKQSPENQKTMDNINDAIQKQEQLRQLLEDLKYDPNNQDLQDLADDLQNKIDQANERIRQDPNAQNGSSGSNGIGSLKQGLQDAMQQAQEATQQMSDAFNNFFGDDDGDGLGSGAGQGGGALTAVPYQERLRLANELQENDTLKEISKKLGRMKKMLSDLNKKPSKHGSCISDVGTGNNVGRILSSEKLLLIDDDLEAQFYKKLMNKSLLQYMTNGLEEMKGPIVVCIDDSGSMSGSRDYWAKAIAIAMLQLAMKDKRAYRCIIFSDSVDAVYDFDRDSFSTDKMIEMASFFESGGTSFYPALQKAVESIEENKFKKADILFITDGDPYEKLPQDFKAKYKSLKEEKEFKTQGIIIGGGSSEYLDEFCDSVTNFKDLNKDNALSNIFRNIKENVPADAQN